VPPQLASALAKSCIDLLRKINEDKHLSGHVLSRSA
ncbi:MAG: Unknown protein, partial [uncultured Sulfurovum sp.]